MKWYILIGKEYIAKESDRFTTIFASKDRNNIDEYVEYHKWESGACLRICKGVKYYDYNLIEFDIPESVTEGKISFAQVQSVLEYFDEWLKEEYEQVDVEEKEHETKHELLIAETEYRIGLLSSTPQIKDNV